MARLKHILGIVRAPFLLLTPACVFLGAAVAVYEYGRIDALRTALVLAGALAAHVGVNALNEYSDFRSGLDASTERTPFSGGSGTLPAQPGLARTALAVGLGSCVLTAAVGLYFAVTTGVVVLLIAAMGLSVVLTYTVWVTRSPVLCLIAPGFGFGSLMVVGTHLVLAGHVSAASVFASLVPFFLVNNLLLLNQFPDVEADRAVGRRHLPIMLGTRTASFVYIAFLLAAFASVGLPVALGVFPRAVLLGLVPAGLAVPACVGVVRHRDDARRLTPFMGLNVMMNLTTPCLMAVGLLIA